MEKFKHLFYPVKTIILPLLIIFFISIWVSSIFEFIDYEILGFSIKLSELKFSHPRKVAFIAVFMGLIFFVRKFNPNKEYAPSNLYGDYPILIYYVAWLLLGYRKVNLKMKPIPLQFQLLKMNFLECFDDTIYMEKDYKYNVSHKGDLSKETNQINIVVSDTYPIKLCYLPPAVIDNYSIIINRDGESGIRICSKSLIEIMNKEVQKSKKYCNNFNLFLSTPASTNKEIFQQIFQTGLQDKFTINIYQQDCENNFQFKEKPVCIKC